MLEQKKEGQYNFLGDIDTLLSSYNDIHSHELATSKLIPLVRRSFGTIFFMSDHYTFEELTGRVERFDQACLEIRKGIEMLQQEEQELLLDKKAFSGRDLMEKVKAIRLRVEEEKKRYAASRRVEELLENEQVKTTVVGFCKRLSHLQFSGEELSKKDLTNILFTFLWIVNHFTFDFEDKPKSAAKALFRGGKAPSYDAHSFDDLLKATREKLDSKEVEEAAHMYKELLKKYSSLDKDQQAALYGELFILWFEIHFFEQRSM